MDHEDHIKDPKRLKALQRFFILDTDKEPVYDSITQLAAYILQAPVAVINFLDENRQWFKSEIGLGTREFPITNSICARALLGSGAPVIPDLQKDPRFSDNPYVTSQPYFKSYAGAPLRTEDGFLIGTLCVLDYKPRIFDAAQINALKALAQQVMISLELRYVSLLQREYIDDQKILIETILENEDRLEHALEGAGDGVWDWNIETNEVFYSRRWKEILGYNKRDSNETFATWSDLVHPDDLPEALQTIEKCLKGDAQNFVIEYRMAYKSGKWLWILSRAVISRNDSEGKPIRMTGTITDITETKNLYSNLQKSHNLLSNLAEQVPGVLYQFEMRADGRSSVPFASAAIEDVLELKHDEIRNDASPAFQRVHKEDFDAYMKSVRESAHTLRPWHHEFRVDLPKKGIKWLLGHAHPSKLEDGSILWHGFITDITERKAQDEERMYLSTVLEKVATPIVVTDTNGHIEWANTAFSELTGFSANEILGKRHEDFLQGPVTNHAVLGEARLGLARQQFFEIDLQLYHKLGKPIWINLKADPIAGENNYAKHFVCIHTDITERKKAEELIWKQANNDALTNLANRRLFRDRLEQNIHHAQRTGSKLALLFIDLDSFKETNDLLGHDIGDMVLIEAAKRLKLATRETDTVARLGGDEFTVILSELNSLGPVNTIAENIRRSLAEPFELLDEKIHLSASIGIAIYPNDSSDYDTLLNFADQAMYAAKGQGKNQIHYFTHELQEYLRPG